MGVTPHAAAGLVDERHHNAKLLLARRSSVPSVPSIRMRVFILFVAASAILHGTDAAGREKKGREDHKETTTQSAGARESRSPYSTEDVVSARTSGRFTLEFVMKAAADGSGGVIEDWIRAGGSIDDRDTKVPRRG